MPMNEPTLQPFPATPGYCHQHAGYWRTVCAFLCAFSEHRGEGEEPQSSEARGEERGEIRNCGHAAAEECRLMEFC